VSAAAIAARLRKRALSYPETYEESPWGDRVVKVKGKIFLFCGAHDGELHLSVKLPESGRAVLREAWARPTPYGLGKSGWVSARFGKGARVPEERVLGFIDESYRALAPKKLVALLDAPAPEKAVKKPRAKSPTKKLAHQVLLLTEDELRHERAAAALAAHGIHISRVRRASEVRRRLGVLDAVIVDLGRSADDGLSLAAEIDASDHPIHLFLVGIRDARAWRAAETAATSAERFRAPPGDSEVAAAIAATLRRHKPRRS
jgi:predicted DNA-binding protein (MmcQ/YjbR family)